MVRWINVTDNTCIPVEIFHEFGEVTSADPQGLLENKKTFVERLGFSFSNLQGQGYDGAGVMSGVYGDEQRLIKVICTSPVPFVYCASHNVNLVIDDAVGEI